MQGVSNTATTLSKEAFKFGNMNIPAKLIFYQKNYIYAMVPLAPKLSGRKKEFEFSQ
jgi:hypothetical protein